MSLLSNLSSDSSIADEKDILGDSRVLNSGLYKVKVVHAYVTKSDGGAVGLVLNLKTDAGQDLRSTQWMTSGTAKGAKNFYEKDGEKHYLPGFIMANALCLLTVGKEISQLETETKVIPVYNSEAKGEIPTKVEMLTDLLGQEVLAGVIKQTVDKTKKNPITGVFEATGETREENEIDKLFRARDRMTTAEIRAKAETAAFADTWVAKWEGKDRNKSKGASASGTPGLPKPAAAASSKPTASLFG